MLEEGQVHVDDRLESCNRPNPTYKLSERNFKVFVVNLYPSSRFYKPYPPSPMPAPLAQST